jgi:uncharacterized protein
MAHTRKRPFPPHLAPGVFAIAALAIAAFIAWATFLAGDASRPVLSPADAPVSAAAGSLPPEGFPALTGRVVDRAELLDPAQEAAIEARLAAHEAKSSDQVVVATIPTLGGAVLEDYANRLFRHWGLGQAGENNGVLLLVARDDRKIRIEVGYGLEGALTDAAARIIIENAMVPAFRAGDFAGGISEAADLIVSVLSGDMAELEARAKRNPPSQESGAQWPVIVFMALWFTIFFTAVGFSLLAPMFGRKLGPGRYEWLGVEVRIGSSSGRSGRSSSGWSSGSSSGGFSGGGGSSGGGGASGSW